MISSSIVPPFCSKTKRRRSQKKKKHKQLSKNQESENKTSEEKNTFFHFDLFLSLERERENERIGRSDLTTEWIIPFDRPEALTHVPIGGRDLPENIDQEAHRVVRNIIGEGVPSVCDGESAMPLRRHSATSMWLTPALEVTASSSRGRHARSSALTGVRPEQRRTRMSRRGRRGILLGEKGTPRSSGSRIWGRGRRGRRGGAGGG